MKHFMERTAKFVVVAVMFAAVALVGVAPALGQEVTACSKGNVAGTYATAYLGTPATGAVYDAVETAILDSSGGYTGYITWHANGAAAATILNGSYANVAESGTYTVNSNCTGTLTIYSTGGPYGGTNQKQTFAVNFLLFPDPPEIQAVESDALGQAVKDMKAMSSEAAAAACPYSAATLGQPYTVAGVNYAPTFAGSWSGYRGTTAYNANLVGTFSDLDGDQSFDDSATYTMGGVSANQLLTASYTLNTTGVAGTSCNGTLAFSAVFTGGFAFIVDAADHRVYMAEMDAAGAMAAVLVQIQEEVTVEGP